MVRVANRTAVNKHDSFLVIPAASQRDRRRVAHERWRARGRAQPGDRQAGGVAVGVAAHAVKPALAVRNGAAVRSAEPAHLGVARLHTGGVVER